MRLSLPLRRRQFDWGEHACRTHPGIGASWEGFALEQVVQLCRAESAECYFWATHTGAGLDLLIVRGTRKTAFEFKHSSAPKATRSMHSALEDLGLDRITIVCPGGGSYPLADRILVTNPNRLAQDMDI